MCNIVKSPSQRQYVTPCSLTAREHKQPSSGADSSSLKQNPHSVLKIVKPLYPQPLCLRTLGALWRNHIITLLCRCQSLWVTLLTLTQTVSCCNFRGRQMPLFPQANGLLLLWNDTPYQSVGLRASVRKCSGGDLSYEAELSAESQQTHLTMWKICSDCGLSIFFSYSLTERNSQRRFEIFAAHYCKGHRGCF